MRTLASREEAYLQTYAGFFDTQVKDSLMWRVLWQSSRVFKSVFESAYLSHSRIGVVIDVCRYGVSFGIGGAQVPHPKLAHCNLWLVILNFFIFFNFLF